jgi:transposase-like protein
MEPMQYPTELRETVVRKALAREMPQEELARIHGVSKSSVQQWLRMARERGETAMVDDEKRARDWSAEERFAALVETHGMSEEELGVWCRHHGLHTHVLAQWRRSRSVTGALLQFTIASSSLGDAKTEAVRIHARPSGVSGIVKLKDK